MIKITKRTKYLPQLRITVLKDNRVTFEDTVSAFDSKIRYMVESYLTLGADEVFIARSFREGCNSNLFQGDVIETTGGSIHVVGSERVYTEVTFGQGDSTYRRYWGCLIDSGWGRGPKSSPRVLGNVFSPELQHLEQVKKFREELAGLE